MHLKQQPLISNARSSLVTIVEATTLAVRSTRNRVVVFVTWQQVLDLTIALPQKFYENLRKPSWI